MCVESGKKILWDEKRIVEEELEKLKNSACPVGPALAGSFEWNEKEIVEEILGK